MIEYTMGILSVHFDKVYTPNGAYRRICKNRYGIAPLIFFFSYL